MISIFSCILEAHNPEKNIHRFYAIEVGKNLFDLWTIETRFGRKKPYKSSQGQHRIYMMNSEEEAQEKVKQIFKKRYSAQRRIGTPYSLTHTSLPSNILSENWLPKPDPQSQVF